MKNNSVLFVGPLPPPVHGFSLMTLAILNNMQMRGSVIVVNRSPKFRRASVRQAIRDVLFSIVYLIRILFNRPNSIYLALSGGNGQFIDIFYVLAAKLVRAKLFIHHHSFAYINERSRILGWIYDLCPRAINIVLCDCMRQGLSRQYSIHSKECFWLLSNRALLSQPNIENININAAGDQSKKLVIGFLSNITAEKGIFEFIEAVGHMCGSGLPVVARIAGPIAAEIEDEFRARINLVSGLDYVGPVYGADKEYFLNSLDVLMFPSKYVNEAEPVTLYEAMLQGVYVIATDRGCISASVPSDLGLVVPIDKIVSSTIDLVSRFCLDLNSFRTVRSSRIEKFKQIIYEDKLALETLMDQIMRTKHE